MKYKSSANLKVKKNLLPLVELHFNLYVPGADTKNGQVIQKIAV